MRRLTSRPAPRPIARPIAALACIVSLAGAGMVLAEGPVALGAMGATPALAASCPGSAGECPYSAAAIIGMRAEGVLRFPEAVAVDAFGDVYVADQLSFVVQKFSAAGQYLGQWGSFGGGHGQFGPIGGLATDAAGNVYVVDSEHNRIEKFSPAGEFVKAWGRFGKELGRFNFGSSLDPTKPPGGGIAVYGSYVYVADSGNDRIERFNLEGGEALAWGSYGTGAGQFSYPRGVVANASEVLVADPDNHRIEKFSPAGLLEGADGSAGSTGDRFDFPYGIALDAAGNVYLADDINHRIVKLSPTLGYLAEWGGFGSKPGQLAFPRGLAADPAGETFVADTANDRVQVFDPEGHFLRTIGASARGPGPLTGPRGLAIDPTGRLFVSDTVDSRVEEFAPLTDAYLGTLPSPGGHTTGFNRPAGIAVDPRGSIYVADPADGRISRFWGDGTYLSEIGGPADIGGAGLSEASSMAVAAATGDLYVADTFHNRVLVYSPTGTLLARYGAGAGNGSPGSGPGEFNHPEALAVDGAGDIYVADTGNNRVVELSPSGAPLAQWGSRGNADGRLHSPTGITLDAASHVYVVDSQNNRVEVFDSSGHFLEKWGERGIGPGEFSQPTAIAVDCAGNVYVADTNNNRVERFTPVSPFGAGCLAPGLWPPPLNVAPVLHVSLPRPSGVLARRALAPRVSCVRGCKMLVSATLSSLRPHRTVKLISAFAHLAPKRASRLRVRLPRAALRTLQRALGRHRGMRAHITFVAAGPTGLRTTVHRTYAVTR
ncbi:MAG: 6-bladed beta-propeller [Solirubrobacteraceae bacterium]